MKTVLAAGLLVAKTPIRAYICGNGASALTFVIFVGINAATITCNRLPGNYAAGASPKEPKNPAQAYLTQIKAHGKCSASSPCTALCAVELTEDSFEALDTLLGEQKTNCEAAGGTHKSRIV